ncbi:MAG: hypothetical protein Q8936_18255 [Bacillota bacterium]|nr:hypothetical protein [Bacillota bacterium]
MDEKMTELQKGLKMHNISEYQILSYNNFELKIAGSFDFAYYHNVEITFRGVTFIMCLTKISRAKIRMATNEERYLFLKEHNSDYMEDDEILVCFDIDNGGDKQYILAESFDFVFEDVFYYKRDKLEEGQRIADWVK